MERQFRPSFKRAVILERVREWIRLCKSVEEPLSTLSSRQFSVDPELEHLACRCCGGVRVFQFFSRFKKPKGIERVSRPVPDPVLLRESFPGQCRLHKSLSVRFPLLPSVSVDLYSREETDMCLKRKLQPVSVLLSGTSSVPVSYRHPPIRPF